MLKKPIENVSQLFDNFSLIYTENEIEYQKARYQRIFDSFKNQFSENHAFFASSPGRVELCGNHTDHNGGIVLACAINLDTICAFLPTDDNKISILSEGYPLIEIDLNDYQNVEKGTSKAIVCGIVKGLENNDRKIGGFKAFVTSNVLGGAGVSSSASFELLIVEIFNFLYNNGDIDELEKAKISQYAENVYFEKACGLLDQASISYGGVNYFDFYDQNNLKVIKVENKLEDLSLILVNTGGSHADLSDEYSAIPNDMFSVAKCFGKNRLCEIDFSLFFDKKDEYCSGLTQKKVGRAEHFFEENIRVENAKRGIESGGYNEFFKALNESGKSSFNKLKNCYVEGDNIMAIPKALDYCSSKISFGACRIHGGGFAGCVLCVVKGKGSDLKQKLFSKYGEENILPVVIRQKGVIVL